MNIFKKLLRSKTIIGIFTAAIGAAVKFAETALPEYGALVNVVSAALSASGLGLATYGRVTAQGPISTE